MMRLLALACILSLPAAASAQQTILWRFNSLSQIAGTPVTVVGSPALVETELGQAIHFNGHGDSGDALFLDNLPLAGTLPYTLEVIFRPASGGAEAQRFFHLQEAGSESRRMFELRIVPSSSKPDKWCLDTVAVNVLPGEPPRSGIMLNCDSAHLFQLDQWYAIATTYDGKVLRTYINGIPQGEIAVSLLPLGKGGTSVGTRYTKASFFKGDIFSARFTPAALPLKQLLNVPTRPASH